ncbi:16S rRNA processing protein RimM [bacterium]|nr:MAG: 16S rRNA processing protein RimM [bacterium]
MDDLNLYRIAKILRGHGIKGELKFTPVNKHFDKMNTGIKLYLADRFNKVQEVQIEKIRITQTEGIVKFKEIADRTEADKFSGGYLLIDKSDLPKLPKNEFYVEDLIGMDIVDETGRKRGVLNDIYSQSAYDIYEVLHDGKKSLIPAVEEFVTFIDKKKRTITVHVIDGLIE